VYAWNKQPGAVRLSLCFLNHPGLGFLKANLPVDILAYPSQQTFEAALESRPDALGISFHINETEIALRMARQARARGIKEVWAGNYGAYNPAIAADFDRVFQGWSEGAIAQALGLEKQARPFVHPELYGAFGSNLMTPVMLSGTLYTSRGCPWSCNFCQTPQFYGKPHPIPLEEIERILGVYQARGIRAINILDENFGTFRSHSRKVAELLHRYQMRWLALTRVDALTANFDHWLAHGLMGAHLGIESLNTDSLRGALKRVEQQSTIDLLHRMSRHNLFVQAFYILGFEQDTVASIERDILELARLDIDLVQVQILTPYPGTAQADMIEQTYGIFDRNLSKYNSRNLVWNHPKISPEQMRELQFWADRQLATSRRAFRTLAKVMLFGNTQSASAQGLRMLARELDPRLRALKTELAPQVAAARQWQRAGWRPYEEFRPDVALTSRRRPVATIQQATGAAEAPSTARSAPVAAGIPRREALPSASGP
jgi:radical SAM superfamily enzyme YgiQ (UPF0313 family)